MCCLLSWLRWDVPILGEGRRACVTARTEKTFKSKSWRDSARDASTKGME